MFSSKGIFQTLDTGIISTLFKTELRMLLRDRRTVVVSIVVPLLVMPILLLAGNWTERIRETRLAEQEYAYTLTGPWSDYAGELMAAVQAKLPDEKTGENANNIDNDKYRENENDQKAVNEVESDDNKVTPFRLRYVETADPEASLDAGEIQFYLQAFTEALEGESIPVVRVVFRADSDASAAGARRIMEELREHRRGKRYELVRGAGFPVEPEAVIAVRQENLADAARLTGLQLGRLLSLFVLLFILMSGAVVATDSFAGEKERGTLETLLTTAAGRGEIVLAKLLLIFLVSLVVVVIQAVNFLVYIGFELVPLPAGFSLDVNPAVAGLLLFLFVPVAALSSATLLLVSGYARSYKEAQMFFSPVMLLGLLPAMAPFLPGLDLRSAMVLLPVANIALGVKEVLIGDFDWPMLGLAWLVTAGAAVLVTRRAAGLLSVERLITPTTEGPTAIIPKPVAFRRHVLPGFAIMWALLLVAAFNRPEDLGLAGELLINLGIIFTGGSVFFLWRYRLPLVKTLSLRLPRAPVWPAVLVGVPAAMLAGQGVFYLANYFFPVPPELLEAFSTALFPEHLPLWSLILLIGVAPGVCEEIAFRGVLLHGLRGKYGPIGVVVINGLIFGLFHVSLFRILPTAFLGMVFAAVTLFSGSIFPAMVWHTLNNVAALLLTYANVDLSGVTPVYYLLGALLLGIVLWIIARYGQHDR